MSYVAKLDMLTHCPVCGAERRGSNGKAQSLLVIFQCNAVLVSYGNDPIKPERVCPAPSLGAVEALNDEVSGAEGARS